MVEQYNPFACGLFLFAHGLLTTCLSWSGDYDRTESEIMTERRVKP